MHLMEIPYYSIFGAVTIQRYLMPTGIRRHSDSLGNLQDLEGPSESSKKNEHTFTIVLVT